MTRVRFDGSIAGIGTTSGTRLVVGMWTVSPFGEIVDVMIEQADGQRILLAPRAEVADFVAATYTFDETRIEPISLISEVRSRLIRSASLTLHLELGRRTAVGGVLSTVPRSLTRSTGWCRAIDPIARVLRPGVRTVGSAGGGRREYYCALDEHALMLVTARWQGQELGELRPVTPPVRFGFGSTPRRASVVRVTTIIDLPTP